MSVGAKPTFHQQQISEISDFFSDVTKNNEYRALFGEQASQILSRYEHKHDHIHTDEGEIKKN